MMRNRFLQLWKDDAGSVIATEYLALAGIVVLGGTAGLVSMRDATVAESQETANSIRAMNQSYRAAGSMTKGASTSGSQVVDKFGQEAQTTSTTP